MRLLAISLLAACAGASSTVASTARPPALYDHLFVRGTTWRYNIERSLNRGDWVTTGTMTCKVVDAAARATARIATLSCRADDLGLPPDACSPPEPSEELPSDKYAVTELGLFRISGHLDDVVIERLVAYGTRQLQADLLVEQAPRSGTTATAHTEISRTLTRRPDGAWCSTFEHGTENERSWSTTLCFANGQLVAGGGRMAVPDARWRFELSTRRTDR